MKKRTRCLIGVVTCLIVVGTVAAWTRESPYQQWESKDGTLQFIVTKRWFSGCLPRTPGQGGDAPGFVTVRDKTTGKVIMRKKVEMVSMAADELRGFRGK